MPRTDARGARGVLASFLGSVPPHRWRLLASLLAMALVAGCASGDGRQTAPRPSDDAETSAADGNGPPPGDAMPDAPSASSPPEDPQATSDGSLDRTALRAELEPLLETALEELDDANVSVLVSDELGQPLLAHAADTPLLPASTLKLVTAAAVLITLGPDARLSTTVETTAAVDEGVVGGDVHLVGGGDPLLATPEHGRWVHPARPRTPLEDLADALVDAGVEGIDGDVIGRAPDFSGPLEGPGWRESYLTDFNARRIAGLTVDAGVETLVTWPEDDEPGDDEPEDDDPTERPSASDPDAEPERVDIEQSDDPVSHAATELERLLAERGVEVSGEARGEDDDEAAALGTLARVHSAPMEEVLRYMVQHSDNQIADTLAHLAGRARTGEGTWERGERAMMQVLAHLGVTPDELRLADGSGLSRDARLTATSLVDLDRAMADHRHGEVWASLLAVAGEPGTLETRLRDTPAQGRLLAKTGSLRDVVSLSGLVRGDDGQHHRFAVLANDATDIDRAVVHAFIDELVLHLAADVQDCPVQPVDGDDGPLGRPPMMVAC